MKKFGITLLSASGYYAAGMIVYLLLAMLFSWMSTWHWFFVVLIGFGEIAILIGLGQMIGTLAIPLMQNIFGNILFLVISARLFYFTLSTIIGMEFGDNETLIKIIGSITFALIYGPGVVTSPAMIYKIIKEDIST
jgi:hypothetical protein